MSTNEDQPTIFKKVMYVPYELACCKGYTNLKELETWLETKYGKGRFALVKEDTRYVITAPEEFELPDNPDKRITTCETRIPCGKIWWKGWTDSKQLRDWLEDMYGKGNAYVEMRHNEYVFTAPVKVQLAKVTNPGGS
ncbi:hypothetical protein INS49_011168 [Diaporthe citri]|uniref:uncharacterized protein n=1 Tax=Diaporthe citri TaxID=83186 RepID=UPI001C7FB722|nr:uncharacterized protein INS49_011168 [Diaporthe citri]KAG6360112.1 hypothetical protein INS49_011168 [Diaporthe citri]